MTTLLDVTYYTDPLCSWSWAFEPVWLRLRYELGNQVAWRYRMGGMIADWQHYADPLNDVSAASHLGPQWLEVSRVSGMPIEPWVWHDDPPTSSYPACLAVKAAALQGAAAGERYLRRAREAVMLEGRNIARRAVLIDLAREIAAPGNETVRADAFDVAAFERALAGDEALDAFREDLRETRYRDIARFPTLIVRGLDGRGAVLVGYRPYDALWETVSGIAGPDLVRARRRPATAEYTTYWNHLTARLTRREIAEACDLEVAVASATDGS